MSSPAHSGCYVNLACTMGRVGNIMGLSGGYHGIDIPGGGISDIFSALGRTMGLQAKCTEGWGTWCFLETQRPISPLVPNSGRGTVSHGLTPLYPVSCT